VKVVSRSNATNCKSCKSSCSLGVNNRTIRQQLSSDQSARTDEALQRKKKLPQSLLLCYPTTYKASCSFLNSCCSSSLLSSSITTLLPTVLESQSRSALKRTMFWWTSVMVLTIVLQLHLLQLVRGMS
jgi:hypothetical protein